ncbi:type II toxin-antitoxin system VapC family toxin [Kribbella sp. NPDC051137]|uniref:type II toxin-antitoxin system VapC family toxin n=1 Tax=Kribbella sp. NPDC051137 TaxID=3155045 RepID=UPI0034284E08
MALDSNVLIDLQLYGSALLNDELPEVEEIYGRDLAGLSDLINLWMLRDIRFVVTPRSLTDAKRGVTPRFLERRLPAVQAIAESLAFQFGDWTVTSPSYEGVRPAIGQEQGLSVGADRDLVLEAQAISAHVFLTRDREVLEKTRLSGPRLALLPPSLLADELVAGGVQPMWGGTCETADCPYDAWSMPAPDMGKWSGLFSIFEQQ